MNLYIAHVGFYDQEIGIYELHTNIHIVAPDIKTAKEKIISMPIFQSKKMHIDGIEELLSIDGYHIRAVKSETEIRKNRVFNYEDLKALL